MTRVLGTGFRNSVESRANTELLLVFATITHPSLGKPIRVITEDINGISINPANGKIINYNWNGNLYLGCPFSWKALTDDDKPPRATISIQNVDRKIGLAVLALVNSPRFEFAMLKLSDFVAGVYDANNAVSPSGTPEVNYNAKYLFLQNISVDEAMVTADVVTFDIANEPCPSIRTTMNRTRGLYR